MKLSEETLARRRPQQFPMAEHLRHDIEEQLELGDFPPMTANRAKDFPADCKRCQRECGYCRDIRQYNDFNPLGR